MTRKDYEEKTLGELIIQLQEEGENVCSYEELAERAKDEIDNGNLFMAIHLLTSLRDEEEYYLYDHSMGTLETPSSISCKEDIEHLIEE